MTDVEPVAAAVPPDNVDNVDDSADAVEANDDAPKTRGPLTVEYCPYCTMPPEYCEFSLCYQDKCRPWLEKNHPELLVNAPPPQPVSDATAAMANLAVEDRNAAKKKSAKLKHDDDEDDDEDDAGDDEDASDEEEDAPKKKVSAAAALRAKASSSSSGVLIRKEQRSRNKFITAVKGCEHYGVDLKKMAKALSKKFACAASVVKNPDQTHEVQIQGDVSGDLPDWIVAECAAIDRTQIYFVDPKTSKKIKAF